MTNNMFISRKYAILWDNKIHTFSSTFISHCPNLSELSIDDNDLYALDKSVFEGNHSRVRVTLSDNPWRCDSDLAWLCDLHFDNYNVMGTVTQFKTYGRAGIEDYGRQGPVSI